MYFEGWIEICPNCLIMFILTSYNSFPVNPQFKLFRIQNCAISAVLVVWIEMPENLIMVWSWLWLTLIWIWFDIPLRQQTKVQFCWIEHSETWKTDTILIIVSSPNWTSPQGNNFCSCLRGAGCTVYYCY